jgi:drug/metabolite transporter (DMT)-like permease
MNSFPVAYAVAAAVFSSLLYVILKYFQRWNVNNLQGLTFNYLTASTLSFFITYGENMRQMENANDFFAPALMIGLLFILVFYITAMTAQKSGLAIASIASKMSMAIPIFAGVFLFNDQVTVWRIAGVLLALFAVFLSGSSARRTSHSSASVSYILPVLLFFGSGLVDTSIKISEHYFIKPENINLYFAFLFGTAGIFGLIGLGYKYFKVKQTLTIRSVAAGVGLGVANYFSLIFLVSALAAEGAESSIIFAMVNMLVVVLTTVSGILLFHEKPSRTNIAGLSLALAALFILSR